MGCLGADLDWCGADTKLLRDAKLDRDAWECIVDGDEVFGNPYDDPENRELLMTIFHNSYIDKRVN